MNPYSGTSILPNIWSQSQAKDNEMHKREKRLRIPSIEYHNQDNGDK